MKKHIVFGFFVLIGLFGLVGCAATSPAITADKAAITSATTQGSSQETTLQAQLTAAQNALAVATSQPSMAPQLAGLQATVIADEQAVAAAKATLTSQLTALQTKLNSDEVAAQTQQQATATQITQAVAAGTPTPWGPIMAAVGPVLIAAILGYVNKSNNASSNATAVTTSTNHAAAIATAITAVANSVPISVLPAGSQPAVTEAVKVIDAVNAAVAPVSVVAPKV